MDRLVITGGGGFCGTHLAQRFAARFHIRLFDSLQRDSLRYAPTLMALPNVEFVSGSVLDRDALGAAVDGAAAVIHCAAVAGVSNYYERPLETLHVNILGTFNLLEALADAGIKRVIHFSTSEVYGPNALDVAETAPPTSGAVSDRRWVYSVSKLAGEHATLRYAETYGFNATVVRPFNIYGPRQTGEGAVSNFARRLVCGEVLEIYGDGSDLRAWCHVRDLVTAVELMLENERAFGKVFNIGNPEARATTTELADRLITLFGRGEIARRPAKHSPIPLRTPDISLARSVLGFEPKVGLHEGLRDTLDWFIAERP
jgi:UDP-glucose 4-epimerase